MLEQILIKLKETSRIVPRFTTGLKEADDLVFDNPFAFLLACSLDRGASSELIWRIPHYLKQKLGHLDPNRLAKMSQYEVNILIDELPTKPRYKTAAAKTLLELSRLVANEYNGRAEGIWVGRSAFAAKKNLLRIYGVGPGIADMTINLLHRYLNVEFDDLWSIDVKPDVHVERVFQRTGITSEAESPVAAARRISASYPADIDLGTWEIGRRWCHPTAPDHKHCPLDKICPKIGIESNVQKINIANEPRREKPMNGKRKNWTFEDFCVVYCNPNRSNVDLAKQLDCSTGAIDAVRASVDAVVKGKASPTFPGKKWEEFVRRALAGECKCQ